VIDPLKENQTRLVKACKVVIRQAEGQGYVGHDAIMEIHRALKLTVPDLKRPRIDDCS
jgi:hypothetical protein